MTPANPTYTITLHPLGIVRTHLDKPQAQDDYRAYVAMSSNGVGRVAGRVVTLEADGVEIERYEPSAKEAL